MRTTRLLASLLLVAAGGAASAADPVPASVDDRVRALLARMTLEEKVGQLVQYSSPHDQTGSAERTALGPKLRAGGIGSMLNVTGAAETRRWQQAAIDGSRLRIPLLFAFDTIHGYRTVFPIPLATAASWDLARIERAERIAAVESAAAGLHWVFAPMVDVARDPRWGRIAEGAGEDPFLGAAVAAARVRGFQGDGRFAAPDAVLACAKHLAAYGAAQGGRDYFTTDVTERTLREVYLPPFRAAVDAGVATLMSGFNDVDGTPASANAFLLDQVLRREWGFRGFVVSDWASIAEMLPHGNVADLPGAAAAALLAGLDMDMQGKAFGPHLAELVRAGRVPESRVDAAAGAVLAAKFRLGLFEDPFRFSDEERERTTLLRPEHLEAARDLARRSSVLLKNAGVLPLDLAGRRVALVGPLADDPATHLGAWAGRGRREDVVTLRAALAAALPAGALLHAKGCEVAGADESGLPAAVAAAQAADVVVAALGESDAQSGEARSRTSLSLGPAQLALLRALRATGKPVVLVLFTGRPLLLVDVEPLVDAILVAWHPGTMGGPALVDLLSGAHAPSGRLPLSWPRSEGQIPLFHAHKNSGRPGPKGPHDRYFSHYLDAPNEPHFPFGFGLGYTTFACSEARLSAPVLTAAAPLTVTARVTNTGPRAGRTVVQLYVRDLVGSVTRPVRELKGFAPVELAPGESRDVEIPLRAADLAFWRADRTWAPEPGEFTLGVGFDATAPLTARFRLE